MRESVVTRPHPLSPKSQVAGCFLRAHPQRGDRASWETAALARKLVEVPPAPLCGQRPTQSGPSTWLGEKLGFGQRYGGEGSEASWHRPAPLTACKQEGPGNVPILKVGVWSLEKAVSTQIGPRLAEPRSLSLRPQVRDLLASRIPRHRNGGSTINAPIFAGRRRCRARSSS